DVRESGSGWWTSLKSLLRVWLAAGFLIAVAVPAALSPLSRHAALPISGTAWVWSRFSDQVTVTVTPSAATVAELIVGAAVSTRNAWVALNDELAAEESTFLALQ